MEDIQLQFEHLSDAIVCKTTDTVVTVAQLLRDSKSRHVLVLDDSNCPKGVISTVDITTRVVAEGKNPQELSAQDIMTTGLEMIGTDISLAEALDKMAQKNISFLPVVDGACSLVGVLEFHNVLRELNKIEQKLRAHEE